MSMKRAALAGAALLAVGGERQTSRWDRKKQSPNWRSSAAIPNTAEPLQRFRSLLLKSLYRKFLNHKNLL